MEVDRNGLVVLDRPTCLDLLSRASLGRIAISVDALPTVLPVNYRLVGEDVVFRTTSGSKLNAATSGAVVAFETDDIDRLSHQGWSVVVTGIAREVTDPAERVALDRARIPHWADDTATHYVSISTEMVSGRRLIHSSLAGFT